MSHLDDLLAFHLRAAGLPTPVRELAFAKPIGFDAFRDALDYDEISGEFTWKVMSGKARPGFVAGSIGSHGYLAVSYKGVKVLNHRLAWWWVYGEFPAGKFSFIDHINCNRLDNRIANLRAVSRSKNNENLRYPKSNNKTGFLGVTKIQSNGKFKAEIRVDGKSISLGCYGSPQIAHEEYIKAKRKLHEGNTL